MSKDEPRFSRRARIDLRTIVRESKKTWGEQQAIAYRERLDEAFSRIVSYPGIGTTYSDFGANMRRLTVAQHYIYYLVRSNGVYIVRVVHVRMDDPDLGR